MLRTRIALAVFGAFSAAGAASAADLGSEAHPIFLHVGPGAVILSESAQMNMGGGAIPGANVYIKSQITAVAEIGVFVSPNLAISYTGGFPPIAKVQAAGTLAGYGTVGKATYGPMALTATYHFDLPSGMPMHVRPYIGAGPIYMHVFKDEDALLTKLDVKDAWGVAVQAGVEAPITDRVGAFVDFKKARLRTDATGFLGPALVSSRIKLDPLVISAGAAFRF